jgi:hypothetical protein
MLPIVLVDQCHARYMRSVRDHKNGSLNYHLSIEKRKCGKNLWATCENFRMDISRIKPAEKFRILHITRTYSHFYSLR